MHKLLSAVSIPVEPLVNLADESKKPVEDRRVPGAKPAGQKTAGVGVRQSGRLHSKFAGYMAFGAAVFVSLMAAATVASYDVPLMLGGF